MLATLEAIHTNNTVLNKATSCTAPLPPFVQILRMPPYGLSAQKTADVFSTDPIRVLRAVRFAAGFGLAVDPAVTKKEIMKHAHRCKFDAPGG